MTISSYTITLKSISLFKTLHYTRTYVSVVERNMLADNSAIGFIGSLPQNEVLLPCLPSRLVLSKSYLLIQIINQATHLSIN